MPLRNASQNLSIIVEDLLHMIIVDGSLHVPADLSRAKFEARNGLHEKEPDAGADVYLFRHVFHKFPDETYVPILRNQVNDR